MSRPTSSAALCAATTLILVGCGPEAGLEPATVEVAPGVDLDPNYDSSTHKLSGGVVVSSGLRPKLGAVAFYNGGVGQESETCSGTLVTPYWVLTAAHCTVPSGRLVRMGNANETTAPSSVVDFAVNHPQFPASGTCRDYDAKLVKLAQPMWPIRADGTTWEGYRRDLYRGDMDDLDPGNVDIYAYGNTNGGGTGSGVLRFGAFKMQSVAGHHLHYDSLNSEAIWGGDSGAGVLVSSYGSPGIHEDQTIAAVNICRTTVFFDTYFKGTRADDIESWFDSTIGDDWDQFDYPSLIGALNAVVL